MDKYGPFLIFFLEVACKRQNIKAHIEKENSNVIAEWNKFKILSCSPGYNILLVTRQPELWCKEYGQCAQEQPMAIHRFLADRIQVKK